MHLLIGFLAALLVFTLIRYGINSSPKQRRKLVYIVAVGLAGAVLLLLLITGRIHFVAAIVAAIIPFAKKIPALLKYIPIVRYLKQWVGGSTPVGPDGVTVVETSLLTMSLTHTSGKMDGEILQGELKGQRLSQLNPAQLYQLYQLASEQYADSVPVFDAFLQRHIGQAWRKKAEQCGYQFDELNAPTFHSDMDESQALQILGLTEGATKKEILDAHRKLMQKLHPDRGGSNFLAAQVNTAKDVLLNNMNA
ncbi:DnaJ domain-containing protein [Alkalimarinus alittae]|uniref:DnaJ domain-containing protein n=1 Tax=Alkalimarinus alittae TaxID=2961619 RepID=A0ABY6N3P3_9ALTE|nr:DnaJ domain-containing protein [Alkalimarinus alittae]UZE96693.1 DnaJ domain-containing protein [Alkalimarinus alittae]